jgi:hypothetical protein
MMQTRTSFNNYGIAQRLRPCNLHLPLSLRINAIVDDHIAVALVFAKLSNETRGMGVVLFAPFLSVPAVPEILI